MPSKVKFRTMIMSGSFLDPRPQIIVSIRGKEADLWRFVKDGINTQIRLIATDLMYLPKKKKSQSTKTGRGQQVTSEKQKQ